LAKEPRKCWYHSGVFRINNHPCGKQKFAKKKKEMGYCERVQPAPTCVNAKENILGLFSLLEEERPLDPGKRLEFANGVW